MLVWTEPGRKSSPDQPCYRTDNAVGKCDGHEFVTTVNEDSATEVVVGFELEHLDAFMPGSAHGADEMMMD